MEKPINGAWRRRLISVFIFFHLMIIMLWGLPGSKFRSRVVPVIAPYVIGMRLSHSWGMFSPNPPKLNFNVVAEIGFQDGSLKVWEFPRMEKMGPWEKFQKERYRKWKERVRLDAYRGIWPDTCRWIARLHDSPTNCPVSVSLTRYWGKIPPPEAGQDYQPMPESLNLTNVYLFYYHEIEPQDLR